MIIKAFGIFMNRTFIIWNKMYIAHLHYFTMNNLIVSLPALYHLACWRSCRDESFFSMIVKDVMILMLYQRND